MYELNKGYGMLLTGYRCKFIEKDKIRNNHIFIHTSKQFTLMFGIQINEVEHVLLCKKSYMQHKFCSLTFHNMIKE